MALPDGYAPVAIPRSESGDGKRFAGVAASLLLLMLPLKPLSLSLSLSLMIFFSLRGQLCNAVQWKDSLGQYQFQRFCFDIP